MQKLFFGGWTAVAKDTKSRRIVILDFAQSSFQLCKRQEILLQAPLKSILSVQHHKKMDTGITIYASEVNKPLNFYTDSKQDKQDLMTLLQSWNSPLLDRLLATLGMEYDVRMDCKKKSAYGWLNRYFIVQNYHVCIFNNLNENLPINCLSMLNLEMQIDGISITLFTNGRTYTYFFADEDRANGLFMECKQIKQLATTTSRIGPDLHRQLQPYMKQNQAFKPNRYNLLNDMVVRSNDHGTVRLKKNTIIQVTTIEQNENYLTITMNEPLFGKSRIDKMENFLGLLSAKRSPTGGMVARRALQSKKPVFYKTDSVRSTDSLPVSSSFTKAETLRSTDSSAGISVPLPKPKPKLTMIDKDIAFAHEHAALPFSQPFLPDADLSDLSMWGKNHCVTTSNPRPVFDHPTEVPLLGTRKFVSVCIPPDARHGFGITPNNWVLAFGTTHVPARRNPLGLGNNTNVNCPQPIALLNDSAIRQIAASAQHGIALGANKIVYGWGHSDLTGLKMDTNTPTILQFLTRLEVVGVAACSTHTAVWNKNGDLYTFGKNGCWLGLGERPWESTEKHDGVHAPFGKVKFNGMDNIPIRKVACSSGSHTMVLFHNGVVGLFGYNQHGQIGIGQQYETCNTPVYISLIGCVDIACGRYHSLVIQQDVESLNSPTLHTQVFGFGLLNDHRLGMEGDGNVYLPMEIRGLTDARVIRVHCGLDRSYVITEEGCVLMWGKQPLKNRIVKTPTVIEVLRAYSVFQIATGIDFTISLGKKTEAGLVESPQSGKWEASDIVEPSSQMVDAYVQRHGTRDMYNEYSRAKMPIPDDRSDASYVSLGRAPQPQRDYRKQRVGLDYGRRMRKGSYHEEIIYNSFEAEQARRRSSIHSVQGDMVRRDVLVRRGSPRTPRRAARQGRDRSESFDQMLHAVGGRRGSFQPVRDRRGSFKARRGSEDFRSMEPLPHQRRDSFARKQTMRRQRPAYRGTYNSYTNPNEFEEPRRRNRKNSIPTPPPVPAHSKRHLAPTNSNSRHTPSVSPNPKRFPSQQEYYSNHPQGPGPAHHVAAQARRQRAEEGLLGHQMSEIVFDAGQRSYQRSARMTQERLPEPHSGQIDIPRQVTFEEEINPADYGFFDDQDKRIPSQPKPRHFSQPQVPSHQEIPHGGYRPMRRPVQTVSRHYSQPHNVYSMVKPPRSEQASQTHTFIPTAHPLKKDRLPPPHTLAKPPSSSPDMSNSFYTSGQPTEAPRLEHAVEDSVDSSALPSQGNVFEDESSTCPPERFQEPPSNVPNIPAPPPLPKPLTKTPQRKSKLPPKPSAFTLKKKPLKSLPPTPPHLRNPLNVTAENPAWEGKTPNKNTWNFRFSFLSSCTPFAGG